jgi:hypothetical protein
MQTPPMQMSPTRINTIIYPNKVSDLWNVRNKDENSFINKSLQESQFLSLQNIENPTTLMKNNQSSTNSIQNNDFQIYNNCDIYSNYYFYQ